MATLNLTPLEIEALLAVAGEADAGAAVESFKGEKPGPVAMAKAFDRAMDKLRAALAKSAQRQPSP